MNRRTLAQFDNLHTYFQTEDGIVQSVSGVSFRIGEGETVALVGESGCGKSVTALSMMGLIEEPPGMIADGRIWFENEDLLQLNKKTIHRLRGKDIAMIFQEPMSALNPVMTVGEQIAEPLIRHLHLSKKAARVRAAELIERVGIPRPQAIANAYPHELSGGMLQRVMIAMALSCEPKLLIADEPTTALDVTIQAQILDLLRELKEERRMAMLLITHDLGVVAEMADYVVVMYCGKVVEQAPVLSLFQQPKHPYTQGLLRSRPVIGQRTERLYSIPGQVPSPIGLGDACHFGDRCPFRMERCRSAQPPLREGEGQHHVACWLYEEEGQLVESARSS